MISRPSAISVAGTPLPDCRWAWLSVGSDGRREQILRTDMDNALVFADVEPGDTSQATAINAVAQQVSMATGVALAGGILELAAGGGALALADFHFAFLVVALASACAVLPFVKLPADAGAAVSGHRPRSVQGS